jgi:hypothetical protein
LNNAAIHGRDASQLDSLEVATLKGLIQDENDRATAWISNLLCNFYAICRPAFTGGDDEGDPKALPYTPPQVVRANPVLQLRPNPAATWVAADYDLLQEPVDCWLRVKDMTGRVVMETRLASKKGQVVLDTRKLVAGIYLAVVSEASHPPTLTEKFIIE